MKFHFLLSSLLLLIKQYLKHFFRAGNAHSIHSPFVYDFYTKVILPKKGYSVNFQEIESLRKVLLRRNNEIEILDLGAGSRRNKSNRRKISEIAKNAEKPARFGQFFYRLSQYFQPDTILELGTSLGLTTAYFAKALPQSEIYTLEGCPETARLAKNNFEELNLQNISVIVGNIDHTLPALLQERNREIGLAFFDANHRYEPTLRYFHDALANANSNSVFIFDDIYWSKEMADAWQKIKAHPEVTLTIDLFWVGLVFFRKEQAKEDFVLRF